MNHVYKTVFNKSTQTWMAVCEYARSVGCGSSSGGGKSVARGVVGSITFLSFAVLMALQSAHANTPTTIIADKSADKALQPIVLNTASGVVSVNIATPNARGLSNNHYSQFDVGSAGLVLNNNRKAAGTQIAGFVAANPYMARGEASTILNQVNSNNPSHLGGFIEVAGKKADVIIANPSGLVVNGAGFINAGNVHLAAANSQVNHGQVTGYEVGTGHIAAHGKLNLQGTDYAALIAKTAQINDEIYAGIQLDVILGENQVSIQDGSFNQLSAVHQNNGASSTSQQGIALDIAALGGMYAGKIHLIGTDKGFGVNHQGVIAATTAGVNGGLTLDSQGNLVNTGVISANDKLAINTHDNRAQNNGTLLSEHADVSINTAGLVNTGTITSTQNTKIAATNDIDNQGNLYGGVLQVNANTLTNTGKLIQTGTGKLNITTDTLNNTDKAVMGQSLYGQTALHAPSAPSSDQSAGAVVNQPTDNTTENNPNTNTKATSIPSADGFITAKESLTNTGNQALITATGDVNITANQTNNTNQASIDVQSLTTNTLANTDSKIALDDINWQLTRLNNGKGDITARNGMVIDSGSGIVNIDGQLSAKNTVQLSATGMLDNSQGVIASGGDATITAHTIDNSAGDMNGAANLFITTKAQLDNNKGNLSAQADTTLRVGTSLTNEDGKVFADKHLTIITQALTNSGQVYGGKSTTLTASQTLSNSQTGLIASGSHTHITANDVNNAGSFIAGMDREGKLGQSANLAIQSAGDVISAGTHIATQDIVIKGNTLDLSHSRSEAVTIDLDSQSNVSTVNATTMASNMLHISAPTQLDNSQGRLFARQIDINSDKLINHQGSISHSGTEAATFSFDQGLDNSQGNIIVNSKELSINTGTSTLNNHQGSIKHTGSKLDMTAYNVNNSQGKLLSTGSQSLAVTTDIDNSNGVIQADALAITAQSVNNSQGNLLSAAHQSLTIYGDINNHQGVIQAGSFGIDANELNNHQGGLLATDETAHNQLALTGNLSNTHEATTQNHKATITALGTLDISAKEVVNTGQMSSSALSVQADTLSNAGDIISQNAISMHTAHQLNNTATGSIHAGTDLTLDSQAQISHHGKALVGNRFSVNAATLDLTGSHNEAGSISYASQDDITHNNATSLAVQSITIDNTQGTVTNQKGNLTAKAIAIDTHALKNGGIISAKDLTITQADDYTHTNQDILNANTLTLTTQGAFTNQSKFGATNHLTLTANSITNHQDATIISSNTTLNSQTDITNQGLINGDNTFITARDTLDNLAGGRIYGTHLAIQADTLNNTPAKANDSDSHHTAPIIAARERLDISVNTLNNNPNPDRAGKFNKNFDNQALITSLGSLHIGGSLDDTHRATGKADTVINKGATIESGGVMVIDAKTLLNTNADYQKTTIEIDRQTNQTFYRNREEHQKQTLVKSTDPANLGILPMKGIHECPDNAACGVNYDNASPIWHYFNITPPSEPMPVPSTYLEEPELPEGLTKESCATSTDPICVTYNEKFAHYQTVMAPVIQWEETYAQTLEALDTATSQYNQRFIQSGGQALTLYTTEEARLGHTSKKGAPDGALYVKDANGVYQRVGEEVDEITTELVVYKDETLTSDPARMVSGNHLIVHGNTLINDKSQMNTGEGFAILGDQVTQTPDRGLVGQTLKKTDNGRYVSRTVISSRAGTRHKRIDIASGSYTQVFAPLATYELPILNATINKAPSAITINKSALAGNDINAVLASLQANQSTLSADAQKQLSELLAAKQSGQAIDRAVLSTLTKALSQSVEHQQTSVITTGTTPITLPASALYTITADDPNLPIIQTDPAFTNHKNWLSSEYMLTALQSDAGHTHKRLSDGYYEQKQFADQYQLLTGRHIHSDYQNTEIAFKTLMDNGISYAKQINLTPGVALSAEQMATLTTDIVWLVKQPITYSIKGKDGTLVTKTEEALVPKLYQKAANTSTGTLTPDGRYSGISAKNTDLRLTGDLDNHGNIIAKDTTAIEAKNVTNTAIIQGDFVRIAATNDITNQHTLYADSAANLTAGNNITNQSQTTTTELQNGQSSASYTDISQIAKIYIGTGLKDKTDENGNPLTTLNIQAGNYVLNKAANITNAGGNTKLVAQNGINLSTITTSNHIHAIADDNNFFKYNQTTDVGSTITSLGNTTLMTTGDNANILGVAANLQSGGTTAIVATGDVRFNEGRATRSLEGVNKFANKNLISKKTTQAAYQMNSDDSIKGYVSGENVVLKSGGDMQLVATNVLASKDISLISGGDLNIASAANTQSVHQYSQIDKKGVFTTAPTSVTLGKQHTQNQSDESQTTYTGSLIGTTGGNISLIANDSLVITNSDVTAQKDGANTNTGNIYIQATDATITSQNTITSNNHRFAQKTTGVTAGVSSSLANDVQSVGALKGAVEDTNSHKAKLAGTLAAASKLYTLTDNLSNKNLGSIRAQATIGSQSTNTQSTGYKETNDSANITAGNNLIVNLKGKGADSDFTVTGSNITVSNNFYQNVEGDVLYQASTQTDTTDSQNSSKGWGAGVYASTSVGTNPQSSYGFTVHANKAKGDSVETATTHTNTRVTVDNATINDIGGDFTLDGANLSTSHLAGTVGGDLIITSRQDTYQYANNQKQAGFSADVSLQGKLQSLGINGGKTDVEADYAQVTRQSGILANQSTLQVQGQGKFTGGYLITDKDQNHTHFAQGIQTQDINNHLSYEGDAMSLGIGINSQQTQHQSNQKPALQGLGYGTISPTHKTTTTHSAITDQAGLAHINTDNFKQADVQHELNELITNDFDKEQVLRDLNAQTIITTEFGKEAPQRVAEFSQKQSQSLLQELNNPSLTTKEATQIIEEAKKWDEGGIYRVALHTAVGALGTGTIEGAASAGTTAYAIPQIDSYLEEQGFDKETRDIALLALSAGIGASIGDDTASAMNNVGQVEWNYLSHRENAKLKELERKKKKITTLMNWDDNPDTKNDSYCLSNECRELDKEIKKLEKLSKQRDEALDKAYAYCRTGDDCNHFYYLHVIQRRDWNKDAERLFRESRGDWIMMSDEENIFHNFNNQGVPQKMPNGEYRYKKFVHNNGQMEIIIDTKDGVLSADDYNRIVRDSTNAGTYNYYGPRQDRLGHMRYDVDPYIDFGNGLGDRTSLSNRRGVPVTIKGIGVGRSGMYMGKLKDYQISPAINKFNESQAICENNPEVCKIEKK